MTDIIGGEPIEVESPGNLYASIEDVRTFKVGGQKVKSLFKYTDDEILGKLTLTTEIIEAITGDCFAVKTETNKFDGKGVSKLFFQPQVTYQLQTVITVKEYDTEENVVHEYETGRDYVVYPYYLDLGAVGDEDRPRYSLTRGGSWPKGTKNIWVDGTWGRDSIPTAIREACILLTLEALLPGSSKMTNNDIKQAVWNDFTVTYKGGDAFGGRTGFAQVDRLLENHINYAGMFQVVPDRSQTYDRGHGSFFRF